MRPGYYYLGLLSLNRIEHNLKQKMRFLKQVDYFGYEIVKLIKLCQNQHADFLRLLFTDSSKIKEFRITFHALFFAYFFENNFSFVIYQLNKLYYHTVFTSQVVQRIVS